MSTIKVITVGGCTHTLDYDNKVAVSKYDGAEPLIAVTQPDNAQKELAEKAGYGDNVDLMNLEHDVLHSFLAEEMGKDYSPTLKKVAFPQLRVEKDERAVEEGMVLAFQRFMNTNDYDGDLWPLVIPYLEKLKEKALKLLR